MTRVQLLGAGSHPSMARYAGLLETRIGAPDLDVRSQLIDRGSSLRDYLARWVLYPRRVRRLEADLFHLVEPSMAHLAGRSLDRPAIVTAHDMIVLRAANGDIPWVGKRWWIWRFRWSSRELRHAAAVVCPSRTTVRDVVELCEIDPQRVHCIPQPVGEGFKQLGAQQRVAARASLPSGARHVVIHVATGPYYKNVAATLEVTAKLRREGLDVALVRVGAALSPEERQRVRELDLDDRVHDLGRVGDERLVELYNAADALLFPSFYEGFGWPVLEAMACGTPVICSDAPALVELVGDAGLTAAATDIGGLSVALGEVLSDPGRTEELADAGLARAASFTVPRMVDAHANLYRQLAAGVGQR